MTTVESILVGALFVCLTFIGTLAIMLWLAHFLRGPK